MAHILELDVVISAYPLVVALGSWVHHDHLCLLSGLGNLVLERVVAAESY
jgi:hypothetical protein